MSLTISNGKWWYGEHDDNKQQPENGCIDSCDEVGAALGHAWQGEEETECAQSCSHELTPTKDDLKS